MVTMGRIGLSCHAALRSNGPAKFSEVSDRQFTKRTAGEDDLTSDQQLCLYSMIEVDRFSRVSVFL